MDERLGDLTACPREPDFIAMYENLGNWDMQQRIRDASKGGPKHCRFLVESPRACECLPSSVEDHAGEVCPSNPYARHRAEFDSLRKQAHLLSEAYRIGDLMLMRMLQPPSEIAADEFMVARIMSQYHQSKESRRKAMQEATGG